LVAVLGDPAEQRIFFGADRRNVELHAAALHRPG
jgi:hypothetical protein